jgi:uncharacterized damage-inducible protein DinB
MLMLDEITSYYKAITQQREKVLTALAGAPSEAWNWTPTSDATNSLFVLATHVIGSEHGWIFEILGQRARTRNRPAEFMAQGTSLDALRAEYARVADQTRQVLESLTEADLETTRAREGHDDVSVRWILLHVVEHSSEHLGQMELTKQLWETRGPS